LLWGAGYLQRRYTHRKDMFIRWSLLNMEGKRFHKSIIDDWNKLLKINHKEEVYHKFISENIGLFYTPGWHSVLAINKLRLDVNHIPDLVIIRDNFSNGLIYNIIELKKPSDMVYTKSGNPSSVLTKAIQQIQNYAQWLKENRTEAQRLFPSLGLRLHIDPTIVFTIIIGRRDIEAENINKRNNFAKSLEINIRSYDFLTDRLLENNYFDNVSVSSFRNEQAPYYANRLANPFYSAISDVEWRNMLIAKEYIYPHPFNKSYKYLLEHRKYSKYYEMFMKKYYPEMGITSAC